MLVTLMAAWFLRERLTRPRWAFVAAGFLGMLLIVRPGSEMLTPAALLALGAAALYATFPDGWTLTGIVVIAGSGVVLTWYERWRVSLPQSEPGAVD